MTVLWRQRLLPVCVLATLAGLCHVIIGCRSEGPVPLVVYCAHDSIFSEEILRRFERETGIPISIRFDTEATKSLGLVQQLIAEKAHPRCDVFWNNEVLGTLDLLDAGVLQPYQGAGYARIPAGFKDPDGHWAGFAARLRVSIVNTDVMEATPAAIDQRFQADDLSRVVVAKPLYGTTLTHYSLLWELWGGDRLRQWHEETRRRGLQEATGNAQVKDLVAAGVCDVGWTDTDDYFVARDAGEPVGMVPVRIAGGATISIPNSVAIIRGTGQLDQAQRLVDFLLSEATEIALARSDSRQSPLGPVDEAQLSDEVRQLRKWTSEGYDLRRLTQARRECKDWLMAEYLE